MKPKMQMILFALLAFLAQGALAATIDVSQPTLVTASDYYERGESVLKDSGDTYWLFYGQSYDFQGNYGSGNPDTHHYDIYYKKAASLAGLAAATPALVGNLPTGTDRIYQGQTTCVEYDGEIWVIAVDMGDGGQVKAWTTGDGGTSWSVADILPDGTDPFNGTHLWATVFSGKIYLAVNRDGDIDVADYDGVSWSGLHEAVDHEGMPRLYADGSHLFLSYSSWASPSYYIYDFTAPSTWTLTATITGTPDMDCDPFLFKVGSDYVFAFAPWDGTQQLLKYWTATTVAGFDGLTQTSAHILTAGSYGATPWVDMWPVALEDGGTTTIFYGTEAEGTAAGHGNIAMLEFDWTPGLDHYCYIQNAVDGAGSGDLIDIATGIYREQVKVDGIALTLQGEGIGNTILEAPDPTDRSTYQITQWNSSTKTIDAILGVLNSTDFNLTGFTIDGRETGPNNFYGVHIFDSNAEVNNCRVEDVLHSASPGDGYVVSLAATQSAGGSYDLFLDTIDIPNFQKCGILVMGPGYTFDVRNNTIANAPSGFIAGNGMQLSYGATGSTLNNDVQGVGYLGEDWAATGILLFESGDVTMSGDIVDNCQTGISYSNWGWIYVHPAVVNIDVEDLDLHDNQYAFDVHLAADNADLNLDITNCDFYDNTGDGLDVYGTDVDPWGGGYFAGWSNGDLVVNVTGCNITDTTGWDVIWTDDSSGNANNVSFTVENTTFGNNAQTAIWNNFTQTIMAERCYWGDSEAPPIIRSGGLRPMPPVAEPFGVDLPDQPDRMTVAGGDRVSDGIYGPVDYDPWWCDAAMTNLCSESSTLAFLPGTNGPINCSESVTM
ncbi:MAG: hypothetical protein K8R91_04695, partial [Phycisphaerae bacterium]|nr:hypothetical protein [Phycisphaerae bacterium]